MSFGAEFVPRKNCLIASVLPRFAVFTTPSTKQAYMISGVPGPAQMNSRLNAPVTGAVIEIARGVLPVGFTCVMNTGPVRNCVPGRMSAMLKAVKVFADEFVTTRTFAAWPPPVWLDRPPGLGVLMMPTGSDVRVLMMTTSPDWNDCT